MTAFLGNKNKAIFGKIKKQWDKIVIPENFNHLDIAQIQKDRTKFREILLKPSHGKDDLEAMTPTEKFAYILALNDSIDTRSLNFNLFQNWDDTSYLSKRKLYLALNNLDFENGVSAYQLKQSVAQIFLASKGTPYTLDRFFKVSSEKRNLELIMRLLHEDLFFNGLYKILNTQNMIKGDSLWYRFKNIVTDNKVQIAMSLFFNYRLIETFGDSLAAPAVPYLRRFKFSAEDLLLVQRYGKGAIPKLIKKNGIKIKVDDYYHTFKRLYTPIMAFILFYTSFEQFLEYRNNMLKKMDDAEDLGKQKVEEIDKMLDFADEITSGIVNAPPVNETILEETIRDFKETYGRAPTDQEMELLRQICQISN